MRQGRLISIVAKTNPPLDERSRSLQALDRSCGYRALAARLLGISRAAYYRHLADLKIEPENR